MLWSKSEILTDRRKNFWPAGLETSYKKINDIRNWQRFPNPLKMGDVMDVAFDDINRCCNGCQIMMGVKTTYTGL